MNSPAAMGSAANMPQACTRERPKARRLVRAAAARQRAASARATAGGACEEDEGGAEEDEGGARWRAAAAEDQGGGPRGKEGGRDAVGVVDEACAAGRGMVAAVGGRPPRRRAGGDMASAGQREGG